MGQCRGTARDLGAFCRCAAHAPCLSSRWCERTSWSWTTFHFINQWRPGKNTQLLQLVRSSDPVTNLLQTGTKTKILFSYFWNTMTECSLAALSSAQQKMSWWKDDRCHSLQLSVVLMLWLMAIWAVWNQTFVKVDLRKRGSDEELLDLHQHRWQTNTLSRVFLDTLINLSDRLPVPRVCLSVFVCGRGVVWVEGEGGETITVLLF